MRLCDTNVKNGGSLEVGGGGGELNVSGSLALLVLDFRTTCQ